MASCPGSRAVFKTVESQFVVQGPANRYYSIPTTSFDEVLREQEVIAVASTRHPALHAARAARPLRFEHLPWSPQPTTHHHATGPTRTKPRQAQSNEEDRRQEGRHRRNTYGRIQADKEGQGLVLALTGTKKPPICRGLSHWYVADQRTQYCFKRSRYMSSTVRAPISTTLSWNSHALGQLRLSVWHTKRS